MSKFNLSSNKNDIGLKIKMVSIINWKNFCGLNKLIIEYIYIAIIKDEKIIINSFLKFSLISGIYNKIGPYAKDPYVIS